MPLRLLCLHGWGTNQKILQSQLSALMHELQRDNTATFSFLEGDVDSDPGPGIAGYYDGPYYSYYRFPRTFSHEDSDESDILEAYEQLSETVALEGPFDGVLGFSHGGTLAAGFMIHHAKMNPNEPALFRCAIFINSLPPFRMEPGKRPIVDKGLEGFISIPACISLELKTHSLNTQWPCIDSVLEGIRHLPYMGRAMMSPVIGRMSP
ncbi:hypothetical protein DTO006G1_3518 [Penicillium roqueforti]|nr:hypothetical protein CBS147337_4208 [Penicillium roqueforti]KAI2761979.1 hypothetical protein DTO006G1_3518 [Penicillium roqueforti]